MAMSRRGEKPPEHMANAIYLEWFSELNGRVVIESADYRLQISEPAWRYTPEEIAERERGIAHEQTPFAIAITQDGETQEWDEIRYEQFLRESDARTERYGRLLEKYADHPDSERIIAREMGWTWLEEALDQQEKEKEQEQEQETDTKRTTMRSRRIWKITNCRRPIRCAKELIGYVTDAVASRIPSRNAPMTRYICCSTSWRRRDIFQRNKMNNSPIL